MWKEELLEELRAQVELAQDVLSIPWAPWWVMVLMQRLSWDLLSQSDAHMSAGASGLVRGQGVPTAAEGEILPGFPGVAIP